MSLGSVSALYSLDSSCVECCYWVQDISVMIYDIWGIKHFSFTIHNIDDVTIVYTNAKPESAKFQYKCDL